MAKKGTTITEWVRTGKQEDGRWKETTYALRQDGAVVSCMKLELSDGSRHNYGWKQVRRALPRMRDSERAMTLASLEREIAKSLEQRGYTRRTGR